MFRRHTTGALAALLLTPAGGCLTDPEIKAPYESFRPERLADGWPVSTPEEEGLDPARIAAAYERLFSEELYPTVRSLLVARHGRLVAEGYPRDPRDRDRLHHVQSVTKSVTSLLMGIALDRRAIDGLDTPLHTRMPEHFDADPDKRALTLRHVLTMTSGLAFDNEVDTGPFIYASGNSVANALSRPLASEPGTRFHYDDATPQLAAGLLEACTGATLEAYARAHLLGPLGIADLRWERHADGLSFRAFGLWLRPRDLAKVGQLMLEGGAWDGRRLVPAAWIERSTRVHQNGDFGFYGWVAEEGRVYMARGAPLRARGAGSRRRPHGRPEREAVGAVARARHPRRRRRGRGRLRLSLGEDRATPKRRSFARRSPRGGSGGSGAARGWRQKRRTILRLQWWSARAAPFQRRDWS